MKERHGMTMLEFMMILVSGAGGLAVAAGSYLYAALCLGMLLLIAWLEFRSLS
jgi:hypothetical protein